MTNKVYKGKTRENGTYEFVREFNIYSVYDKIAEAYMPEFRSQNDLKAMQGFDDALKDVKTPIHAHPETYELWKLATFNERTGEFTMCKKLLLKGEDIVTREQK